MLQIQPIFRSLAHRRFRLYFTGQLISLIGTWMQAVAQAWLVYRLTGSSLLLGVVGFVSQLPVLLFGLFGGALADRLPRRHLLIGAHAVAVGQALALAVLTLGGWVQTWHIIALAALLGLVNAVEMPARHSLIAELVPREDLPNAIALNSGMFSAARFVGPSLAGVLVALFGEGPVFVINAVSFLAVIGALRAMGEAVAGPVSAPHPRRLSSGLRFAAGNRPILAALLFVMVVSLFGAPYSVLMPAFASRVLGGQAATLGLLLGAAGIGAFAAALRLAQRGRSVGLRRAAGLAGVAGGIALLSVARVDRLGPALLILPVLGFAFTTLIAATNTFIQLQAPDALRGRLMALFSMAFIGMTPIGQLMIGALGEWWGVEPTLSGLGAICIAGSVLYLVLHPRLRPAPAADGSAP